MKDGFAYGRFEEDGKDTMRIAIVDNEIHFMEEEEQFVRNFYEAKGEEACIRVFVDGYTLLNELEEHRNFDMYLLDVEMPGMNGLELAGRIREYGEPAYIIFITSYSEYAIPAYAVEASFYVLKNDYEKMLHEALERIWGKQEKERERISKDIYVISNKVNCNKIVLDDILYLTKDNKNVIFHCVEKEYKERATLELVYGHLPQNRFIFINKGCIINMKYVCREAQRNIYLRWKKETQQLSVSRYMESSVKEKLLEYWENT